MKTKTGLNNADLKVLCALRRNGRETMTQISEDTGIPISSVFDRIRRMETQGLIKRYSCSVDWKQVGLNRRGLLHIRMPKHQREKAQAWLTASHHVNNLWRLDDMCGFVAEVMFVDLREQEGFIDALNKQFEDVEISSHEVVENPKWEGLFCDPAAGKGPAPDLSGGEKKADEETGKIRQT